MNVMPDGVAYGNLQKCEYDVTYSDEGDRNDVVHVTFLTPKDNTETRTYADGKWGVNNQHLQLLAAVGKKPSQYDGNTLLVADEDIPIPLQYKRTASNAGWHISQNLFDRGRQVLQQASWTEFGSNVTINVGGSQ